MKDFSVRLSDRPGELAQVATVTTKLSGAGVNLRALYLTGIEDDLVELAIVTSDAVRARSVLE